MKHNVLMDVSGRLEKSNRENSAVAFSNHLEAAIYVPGNVRWEVYLTLGYMGIPRRWRGVRIYVAAIYLLLEDYLKQLDHIVNDDELPSWGVEIRRQLSGLIHRTTPHFDISKIEVRLIGEHTRADRLAWLVRA
jgi:hypothetical protein